MHTITLNIEDNAFKKFMNTMKQFSKDEIHIEDLDNAITQYPNISFEDAEKKVLNAVKNISRNEGLSEEEVFNNILGK
ncbi:MAG: hypothetical protein HRT41_09590 [Campylobacteraceae bacterium]|nr:hypothetical protein [Campylobacteraceae bacterium]